MSTIDRRDAGMGREEPRSSRGARPGAVPDDLHILPGPGLDDEEAVRERLEVESPDGRPPTPQIRREARRLFLVALTVVAIVVLVAIYLWGGPGPTAVALVLWGIFIGFAAWPTWHAAVDRKVEENRARREVAAERHGEPPTGDRDRGISGG